MDIAHRDVAVRFDSVFFSYSDIQVLENVSFHIHKGEFAVMVGPNGSGKTTVLKLLFGLIKPDAGCIEIFGTALKGSTSGEPQRGEASGTSSDKQKKSNHSSSFSAAYVSQQMPSDNLFPITVRDIVRMGLLQPLKSYAKKMSAVTEAMEKAGIVNIASRPYRSLSGGQKRRTLVARALVANPDLLVLDEPTANMDSESETLLYKTLGAYKGKTTILVVTHDTEFVSSLTDRVLCLGAGKKVLQHALEAQTEFTNTAIHHGDAYKQARVLHGENIINDDCCN
ncbi:MAG: ATP-binding cassette domain-containing protein [Treponema sp.]|nr:ATP-binding cassette domain-containing protein [Treponema sp.]MCL2251974.1 ATP-binding cassette domain-containing protein [Treponema sp.]